MGKQKTSSNKHKADWLKLMDKRTSISQDLERRREDLCNDLGGIDTLSYQQLTMIDRCIFLEYYLQKEEVKLVNNDDFDSGKWIQACNSLNGLISKLGIEKANSCLATGQPIQINFVDAPFVPKRE